MSYESQTEQGRALAYIGSILLSIGIVLFGGAAFLLRDLLRRVREQRAEMWQAASAQITSGDVRVIHGRFVDYAIGNVGYAYSIDAEYYSGYLTCQFWDEQLAWTFVDACQNRQVMIKYMPNKPHASTLALRDLPVAETWACRPMGITHNFSPWLAILWAFRNVSEWAENSLHERASNWPSTEGEVEYAEPRMVGDDDNLHWVGDLHYKYSVEGCSYAASHYFRAYGEEDAREQVEAWRGRRVIVHYFPGNSARSVFIAGEQEVNRDVPSSA